LFVSSKDKKRVIGIKHPRNPNILLDTLYIKEGAVATSGDYEKFLITDKKKRYSHILNPYTGIDESDCASVTIIGDKTYLADGYATAVYAMGSIKGKEFMEKNGISGIIVTKKDDKIDRVINVNLEKYKKNDE